MLSLDRMVTDIQEDLRDTTGIRFKKGPSVRAVNEAIAVICSKIRQAKEGLLLNIDNSGDPLVVDLPAATAGGPSKLRLPPTCMHLKMVEIYIGSQWRPIREQRRGEWQVGQPTPLPTSIPITAMSYERKGRYLEFWPGTSVAMVGAARLTYEVVLPKLLMGVVPSAPAATLVLPNDYNSTEGQAPAEEEDDLYNRLKVRIYTGTGAGQLKEITDYAGSTRTLTMASAWAPALDNTSKFAMLTPFDGALSIVDEMVKVRACTVLLSTQRNEDVAMYVSRYNEMETALMEDIEALTPGPQTIAPVDWEEDAYYGV